MEIVEPISCRPLRRPLHVGLGDSPTHGDPGVRKRQKMAPKCEPWNQVSFFSRAKTFSLLNWSSMPVELSPLQCARYGWLCVGRKLMTCECCFATVCINLSNSNLIDVRALTRHYTSQLSKAHQAECVWKDNPCPLSFVSLPDDPVMLRGVFRENFTTWVSQAEFNETGVYKYPALHPETRQLLLECWRKQEDSINSTPSDLILLSACGWRLRKFDPLEERDGPNGIWIMECSYCVRQAAMKSFHVNTTRSTSISEIPWQEESKNETETPSAVYPTHNLFPTEELREPMLFGRPDNAGILGWGLQEWSHPLEPTPLLRRGIKRPRSVPHSTEHVGGGQAMRREFRSSSISSEGSRKRTRESLEEEEASSDFPECSPLKRLKSSIDSIEQDDEKLPSRPKRPRSPGGNSSKECSPSLKKFRTLSPFQEPPPELQQYSKKRYLGEDSSSVSMDSELANQRSNTSRSKRFRRPSTFHPIEEHTYSCPYVLKKIGEAGWMQMIRVLPTDPLYYGYSP